MSAARRCGLGLALALAILVGFAPQDQTRAPHTVEDARALIRAEAYEDALAVLKAIVEREPENPTAWVLLGYTRHQLGDIEGAIEAHREALEYQETAPVAMYNLGLAHARIGNLEQAFGWLFSARDTRQFDITPVAFTPEAASLRDDPRWRELFPTDEEFADPFVEDARILQQWTGEAEGDQFGWIARNIGDVDSDGVNDVTISAPSYGLTRMGQVYAYSGATGQYLWSWYGAAGERLGLGTESAGDVNGDGVPDVIAGAPGSGKIYVFSGDDGDLLITQYGWQADEFFGRKVAGVGDVDGDGRDDVLVGAPYNDGNGEDAGRVYLFSGRYGSLIHTMTGERAGDRFGQAVGGCRDNRHTLLLVGAPDAGKQNGGRVYVYTDLSGNPAFTIESDETGAELGGMFVSVLGDVNGDSVPDIFASDWSNAAKGPVTGRIYVHSGADGSRLLTLTGEAAGDGFGIGPADAGDVNGDGHADLIIGAWQHAGGAPAGGKVYLYSGADGSMIRTYTGKVMGATLGFDVTGMGDVDGDGTIDLLLSSAWSAVNGPRSGRVYLISGDLGLEQPP